MYNPLPVVSLDVVKATKAITFNAAAALNLDSATLLVASSAELTPVETKFDAGTERTTLIFAEELPAGSKATLRVGFGSALTDSMTGYYKSTWEKGIYALTQFEVRVARSCV
jgi:aminopeptidase 2